MQSRQHQHPSAQRATPLPAPLPGQCPELWWGLWMLSRSGCRCSWSQFALVGHQSTQAWGRRCAASCARRAYACATSPALFEPCVSVTCTALLTQLFVQIAVTFAGGHTRSRLRLLACLQSAQQPHTCAAWSMHLLGVDNGMLPLCTHRCQRVQSGKCMKLGAHCCAGSVDCLPSAVEPLGASVSAQRTTHSTMHAGLVAWHRACACTDSAILRSAIHCAQPGEDLRAAAWL